MVKASIALVMASTAIAAADPPSGYLCQPGVGVPDEPETFDGAADADGWPEPAKREIATVACASDTATPSGNRRG